jgi:hypothetical protein
LQSGELVSAKTVASAWGLSPRALGPAAKRGELFGIVVNRQRYYPKKFLELSREDVAQVTRALSALSPEEKLIFWKRPHGALDGKTVGQLLSGNEEPAHLERVIRLAKAWADEGLPGKGPVSEGARKLAD